MKRFYLLALLAVSLGGCMQRVAIDSSKLQVAASFYPLAFIAGEVGGDLVQVTQITPGGVEPHDYEPTAQDLVSVHNAKVFLMNGEGVDAWGDKIIDELKQNGVVTVRMVDTIIPMGGFNEAGEADPTKPSSNATNVYDPHIWLNPVLMEKEVQRIRDAFIASDPSHASTYSKNSQGLLQKLSSLDQEYKTGLSKCSIKDAVVSHNAFRYMAKEYGFTTLAIAGLDPEQEPSPKRIAELADFAKKNGIKYIFFETLVSPKIAETVANEIGATPLVLNPIEGLTKDQASHFDDYLSIMQDNLKNLRLALQCN